MKINNVQIQINQSVMQKLTDAAGRALELTANALLADVVARKVIPNDEGELQDDHFVTKSSDLVYHVVSTKKYARRWYFNLPVDDSLGRHYEPAVFQRTKNANAQDHWMDYYLTDDGMEWICDTFIKFWKKESGGIIK